MSLIVSCALIGALGVTCYAWGCVYGIANANINGLSEGPTPKEVAIAFMALGSIYCMSKATVDFIVSR